MLEVVKKDSVDGASSWIKAGKGPCGLGAVEPFLHGEEPLALIVLRVNHGLYQLVFSFRHLPESHLMRAIYVFSNTNRVGGNLE